MAGFYSGAFSDGFYVGGVSAEVGLTGVQAAISAGNLTARGRRPFVSFGAVAAPVVVRRESATGRLGTVVVSARAGDLVPSAGASVLCGSSAGSAHVGRLSVGAGASVEVKADGAISVVANVSAVGERWFSDEEILMAFVVSQGL